MENDQILHVDDINSENVPECLDEFGTLGTVHNDWAFAIDVATVPHRMEAFMTSGMGRVWVESVGYFFLLTKVFFFFLNILKTF